MSTQGLFRTDQYDSDPDDEAPRHRVMCRDEKCFHRGKLHDVWTGADPVYSHVIVHADRFGRSWNQMVGAPVGTVIS